MTTHPNTYGYVYEKLYVAASGLAAGTGTLQQRIENTWAAAIMRLKESDFPEGELRAKFQAVVHKMTDAPADPIRGTVAVATARMNEAEAQEVAETIFTLFASIAELDALARGPS